tara:strand:+ start:2416 stop:2838 length:423 start_codon:yes stop_codon:yes gene_type:complete
MTNNAIMKINAYKHEGQWVFDDEDRGLVKEPFVAGADTLLDIISGKDNAVSLIFSANDFPKVTHVINRVGESAGSFGGGTDYVFESIGATLDVWLCPALFKFFKEAPETIYVYASPYSRYEPGLLARTINKVLDKIGEVI